MTCTCNQNHIQVHLHSSKVFFFQNNPHGFPTRFRKMLIMHMYNVTHTHGTPPPPPPPPRISPLSPTLSPHPTIYLLFVLFVFVGEDIISALFVSVHGNNFGALYHVIGRTQFIDWQSVLKHTFKPSMVKGVPRKFSG